MTSAGAPQPWPPPPAATDGKSYRVCTQGICSTECPQYCGYFLLPPPPPFFLLDNPDDGGASSSSRSRAVSPLMAALIAVLAAAFLLLLYYTVISRLCRRRPARRTRVLDDDGVRLDPLSLGPSRPVSGAGGGLDDSFIRQITVFRYRRGDGLIEGSDCAVCLSEFAEGESLRLMPNCQHAFHIPCIDTWLKTQSSCPLCRAGMDDPVVPPRRESGAAGGVSLAAMRVERGNDAVLVVREVGGGGDREGGVIVCHEVAAAAVEEEEERESPDRGGGGDGDELGKRDATADHR